MKKNRENKQMLNITQTKTPYNHPINHRPTRTHPQTQICRHGSSPETKSSSRQSSVVTSKSSVMQALLPSKKTSVS